ncbi:MULTISPECIES: ATP-binding protein [unclassified Lentimicrobium]|uniref:ATP-binding protein n=1 Tax=unclassified Lentimicrobium TaxID=2677434 RepID=UPI001557CCF2|nr:MULTISPECIES: ATP-binding protein [unclassified Lentimicrobium]NPD47026.1 ATP-binding protein [Lentimicrobium sp. S6]NPD84847.1 ATP-binding protein [Lentimicrobium sp. L6]
MMLRSKELIIKSDLSELHKLEEFVEQISDVYNVNSTYYSNILVALNEAVTNSIIHGNKENEESEVRVLFESKNKGLFFSVKDDGPGFDFTNYPDPTDISIENYEDIGHGLYLMKSLSDVIEYNEEDKSVELGFKISSINKELAVSRVNSLQAYFSTANQSVKA